MYKLINFMIRMPETVTADQKQYKSHKIIIIVFLYSFRKAFISSEIFREQNQLVVDRFLKEEKLFFELFSFIKPRNELNSLNSSYFFKVVNGLMLNNLTEVKKNKINRNILCKMH